MFIDESEAIVTTFTLAFAGQLRKVVTIFCTCQSKFRPRFEEKRVADNTLNHSVGF
jgi:hypothetical protein